MIFIFCFRVYQEAMRLVVLAVEIEKRIVTIIFYQVGSGTLLFSFGYRVKYLAADNTQECGWRFECVKISLCTWY